MQQIISLLKKHYQKNTIHYLIIFIIAIVICFPLYQKGLSTGHDGDFHISRAIGTIEQIKNGNSPLIISRFSNNLGYAWNLFYPPITTFINVIFTVIFNNAELSMKIFIFITFLFSGISMYKMVKTFSENETAALFSSILYMIAPYRLLNSYVRFAVGEMISFIFIPMVFMGVYLILKGNTRKIIYICFRYYRVSSIT